MIKVYTDQGLELRVFTSLIPPGTKTRSYAHESTTRRPHLHLANHPQCPTPCGRLQRGSTPQVIDNFVYI